MIHCQAARLCRHWTLRRKTKAISRRRLWALSASEWYSSSPSFHFRTYIRFPFRNEVSPLSSEFYHAIELLFVHGNAMIMAGFRWFMPSSRVRCRRIGTANCQPKVLLECLVLHATRHPSHCLHLPASLHHHHHRPMSSAPSKYQPALLPRQGSQSKNPDSPRGPWHSTSS